jgi:hypothetical protein
METLNSIIIFLETLMEQLLTMEHFLHEHDSLLIHENYTQEMLCYDVPMQQIHL